MVDALPLRPGMRVLEVGGAPGAAAREVVRRVGATGHVLVIDRSARGVANTERAAADEIAAGLLSVRRRDAESFVLRPGEPPFDLAFAVRVGAFDGRHPQAGARALRRIAAALTPTARFLVGDGAHMHDVDLGARRPGQLRPGEPRCAGSRP